MNNGSCNVIFHGLIGRGSDGQRQILRYLEAFTDVEKGGQKGVRMDAQLFFLDLFIVCPMRQRPYLIL